MGVEGKERENQDEIPDVNFLPLVGFFFFKDGFRPGGVSSRL